MRLSTIIALGATILALVALAAPAGLASGHQGGGNGSAGRPAPRLGVVCMNRPSICGNPTPVPREAGDGFQPHRRGDTAISSDATTRSDPRSAPLGSTVEAARGFDWADAAIGAAVALGAALLLVTTGRAVRGHGRLGGRAGASAL